MVREALESSACSGVQAEISVAAFGRADMSCLPVFLLSMAVSQWVGQAPCGLVSHVGWELLGASGTIGLSSLVLQPADFSQAGKQVVAMWWGMTEGRRLLSSHSHLLFACHQTAAVRNSHQAWEVNVGPS